MTPFPEIWCSVLLDDAVGDAMVVAHALAAHGVPATPTQEGWLALPGGFLARVEPSPYPSDLLVHPGAHDTPDRSTAAVLHVSGGGSDTERFTFAERTNRRLSTGEAPAKSGRFQKLEALASLLAPLAPLGPGVVVPLAGHRFVPWSVWPSSAGAGEVFGAFVTIGRAGGLLYTRGMGAFAAAELAVPVGPRVDAEGLAALSRGLFDAAFEVAWQGFAPDGPAVLAPYVDRAAEARSVIPVTARSLWLGDAHDASLWDWIFRDNARSVFGAAPLFDDPDASTTAVKIAVNGGLEGPRRAFTVGLARAPRAAGPIELVTTSPRLSRHAALALGEIAELVRANPDRMNAYDRVALGSLEPYGIAGVVLWAFGNVRVGSQPVEMWDVLPVTAEELARFRAGGQGAWMDEVEAANAFEELHARWCGVAG